MSNSNADDDEPPKKYTPTQPSLSSLPDDIVLRCLVRVPRSYHLNISWVSKDLRSLVRSPEFNVLRSSLPKSSLYVCLEEDDDDDNSSFHWFTLNETSTTEYGLVPNPTTFPPHKYGSSTVAVGSKIFFVGGSIEPFTDLWILDTRTGSITLKVMSVPRRQRNAAVEVINRKIYVLGGEPYIDGWLFHQVEVFDPESKTWEVAGIEDARKISNCSATVEEKVYMVDYEKTSVYTIREEVEEENGWFRW
ncbi:unnamed protein product [Brassica oleracea]|uniref:Uncharacterized protein n=2 Tax=Brassica TaxID=3705 RepID=A0A3P6GYP6_BRAOL|nr:unnamed protein product [Brassica oleracea]